MTTGLLSRRTKLVLPLPVGLSVLVHFVALGFFGHHGSYRFVAPVRQMQAVMVELSAADAKPAAALPSVTPPSAAAIVAKPSADPIDTAAATVTDPPSVPQSEPDEPGPVPAEASAPVHSQSPAEPETPAEPTLPAVKPDQPPKETAEVARMPMTHATVLPPLMEAGEFVAKEHERLDYRITMLGLPVGSAVLEAGNERGEVKISLRVKSAPPLSGIYPVDDLIETKHAGGNFIITRIRQQEGSFKSDRGFTIFLRDKKVFWMDLLRNQSVTEPVPNGNVVDLLSALYYLRTRPLQVGKTEVLDVYDSDRYAALPVEVVRREELRLPGFRTVRTLVVKPRLSTEQGIFKRTGDVTIWLTDDQNKAPVRVETEIPLGKVTAELTAAHAVSETGQKEAMAASLPGARTSHE